MPTRTFPQASNLDPRRSREAQRSDLANAINSLNRTPHVAGKQPGAEDAVAKRSGDGQAGEPPTDMTLLELVVFLSSVICDDREIAAAARELLRRGEVRLVGNFRGAAIECFDLEA